MSMNVVRVPIDSIKPHPRNYRGHPVEQVEHIRASLRQYGQYRPIVVSSDGYILAGEGVWTACNAEGYETVETHPMDFPHDDPRAEKLLVADNELSRLAVDDDKTLASLLADIQRQEGGLRGTGYDDGELDAMIAGLQSEEFMPDFQPVGMDEQGRLDQLEPKWVQCPNCGERFDARGCED